MHMAMPTNSSGMPTKAHQKYRGGSKLPNDAKKLPKPTIMKSSPTPAITGPPTRSTLRMLECWGDCSLFSFIPSLR